MLVVEDNESDIFLIQEAMDGAQIPVRLLVLRDGEQAVRFFDRLQDDAEIPCPALVILDINLPTKQGAEVLKHIRETGRCAQAPIVVVSTSDSASDREKMAALGANLYFRKPSDYDAFMKLGEVVRKMLESA